MELRRRDSLVNYTRGPDSSSGLFPRIHSTQVTPDYMEAIGRILTDPPKIVDASICPTAMNHLTVRIFVLMIEYKTWYRLN